MKILMNVETGSLCLLLSVNSDTNTFKVDYGDCTMNARLAAWVNINEFLRLNFPEVGML